MAAQRLAWPDTVKGLCILWIVYFHAFMSFSDHRLPWPRDEDFFAQSCAPLGLHASWLACLARAGFIAFSSLGFHGVGVFIALSGFTLSFTLARKPSAAGIDWRAWYRSRLLRLYPLYWAAHLIYLISPRAVHIEAIDYRFVLSFLGDRVIPLSMIFYYANAAWWYFGLLLQLYLVFPVLHCACRRLGAGAFLALSAAVTIGTRYVFLDLWPSQYSGALMQGALFTCRLFEFTVGMVIGTAYATERRAAEGWLLSLPTIALGAVLYAGGFYAWGHAFVLADGLIGCGLLFLLAGIAHRLERIGWLQLPLATVGAYSYGLYLLHQPYVIWIGAQVRDQRMRTFVPVAMVTTAVLALVSMWIERGVNRVVARVVG
jgi:peptidoglycan/LPS O-acetylase OafA/YrhL